MHSLFSHWQKKKGLHRRWHLSKREGRNRAILTGPFKRVLQVEQRAIQSCWDCSIPGGYKQLLTGKGRVGGLEWRQCPEALLGLLLKGECSWQTALKIGLLLKVMLLTCNWEDMIGMVMVCPWGAGMMCVKPAFPSGCIDMSVVLNSTDAHWFSWSPWSVKYLVWDFGSFLSASCGHAFAESVHHSKHNGESHQTLLMHWRAGSSPDLPQLELKNWHFSSSPTEPDPASNRTTPWTSAVGTLWWRRNWGDFLRWNWQQGEI